MKKVTTKKTTIETEDLLIVDRFPADDVIKKVDGRLDMVIAFDTTGSMANYIDAVRHEVTELIPRLFRTNPDLRLSVVAFGDYCDMPSANEFGDAYQCIPLTDNENALIKFVKDSKDTSGGDGDEFYELVIKKIVEETNWRENSTKAVLLIADSIPHEVGYSYADIIKRNTIDWRQEAIKAAKLGIHFDTLTIHEVDWYRELSKITDGLCLPFSSSHKTADLVEMSTLARGGDDARVMFSVKAKQYALQCDAEMTSVCEEYSKKYGI